MFQLGQVDFPGTSRFEVMIQDPNFMAKTHYFAQRLEELRKLHQFYKNLAKQAPRRNSTLMQSPSSGALPDLLLIDDDTALEQRTTRQECPSLPKPVFSEEGTLSSLTIKPDYNFDWKSLLPEEIEVASESGDGRNDGEESVSDFSKDFSETVYDIQSDIMPYLPSNYVSLSSLTAHRPPDLIMTSNLRYTASLQVPVQEDRKPSPIFENPAAEIVATNITSLSDDETNVKHIQVKKEKRKKKINLLPISKKTSKEIIENEVSSTFSKISWSRLFGGQRRNSSPKETTIKSSKSNAKSSGTKLQTSLNKNSDKVDRKFKERDMSREMSEKSEKRVKDTNYKDDHRTVRDIKQYREPDISKQNRQTYKSDNDKIKSKHSSRKSADGKSGPTNAVSSIRINKRDINGGKQDLSGKSHGGSKQDLSSRGRCHGFQRESLCYHPSNGSISSTSVHPGYDSGADSGVGIRVSGW